MGIEEQKEEREVLESIFPDEITDVSENSYRIAVKLDVEGEQDDGEDVKPTIIFNVSYPEAYPDVAPNLDITPAPDGPRHPLLDVGDDKARLLDALQPDVEDNMGMAMIFTLISTLKDSAELLITERQQAVQALKDVEAAKAEEEENRKFHGTVVTRETFLGWRDKYRAGMAEKEKKEQEDKEADEKKRRGGRPEEKKLTGRQLWERGLAGKVEDDEDSIEEITKGVESVKV